VCVWLWCRKRRLQEYVHRTRGSLLRTLAVVRWALTNRSSPLQVSQGTRHTHTHTHTLHHHTKTHPTHTHHTHTPHIHYTHHQPRPSRLQQMQEDVHSRSMLTLAAADALYHHNNQLKSALYVPRPLLGIACAAVPVLSNPTRQAARAPGGHCRRSPDHRNAQSPPGLDQGRRMPHHLLRPARFEKGPALPCPPPFPL
jgi:hypothetical protein